MKKREKTVGEQPQRLHSGRAARPPKAVYAPPVRPARAGVRKKTPQKSRHQRPIPPSATEGSVPKTATPKLQPKRLNAEGKGRAYQVSGQKADMPKPHRHPASKARSSGVQRNGEKSSGPKSNEFKYPPPEKLPQREKVRAAANASPGEIAGVAEKAKELLVKFQASKTAKILLALGLAFAFLVLFALAPAFRLNEVQSENLLLHREEDLLAASGLEQGQHFLKSYGGSLANILRGRYEHAEERVLATYPELKDIQLRYIFPGILEMAVVERIPLAFVDVDDIYLTIDRYGVVCGSYPEVPDNLPVIRGIEVVRAKVGEPISTNADTALKTCIAVMSALLEADLENPNSTLLMPIAQEIRSSGYQRIVLSFALGESAEQNLRVSCSEHQNLEKDFLWLKRVLDSKALLDKLPGTLEIYGSQLVFRPEKQGDESADNEDYLWQEEVWQAPEE